MMQLSEHRTTTVTEHAVVVVTTKTNVVTYPREVSTRWLSDRITFEDGSYRFKEWDFKYDGRNPTCMLDAVKKSLRLYGVKVTE
jgi:hypothetical protein